MTFATLGLLALVLNAPPGPRDHDQVVIRSIDTLDLLMSDPREAIPKRLLHDAAGVAIIPRMMKAGFFVGAQAGRGLLLVKDPHGGWSNPLFITLAGASFGLQAGAQASEVILVFRSRRSIDRFLKGKGQLTLGGDAGASLGLGRDVGGSTNLKLQAEIIQYAHSKGLYAGLSLQGAAVKMDWNSNFAYYGDFIPPQQLLNGEAVVVPEPAFKLWERMTAVSRMGPGAPASVVVEETIVVEPEVVPSAPIRATAPPTLRPLPPVRTAPRPPF